MAQRKSKKLQPVLVVVKPDAMAKGLTGYLLSRLAGTNLDLIAARVLKVTKSLAEAHYRHLKNKPFFGETVQFLMGRFNNNHSRVLALVYYGENAIKRCRDLTGATNPEEADPTSIRGQFGRITTKGVYENVLHVSSDLKEAEREIKLWFEPDQIPLDLFPSKSETTKSGQRRVWA